MAPATDVPLTRALIVDDEEDMRFLVRAVIEAANNGLAVAGEACDGAEALLRWREQRPEVVVLDHRMPDMTGLEVAEKILAEYPEQQIVLFSAYLDDETTVAARRIGVEACLAKTEYGRLPETLWRLAPPA
ncbi:MAG TPA: response regulator [Frankiaceae bacterium]|jgi:DNA-binding NarL/FixJ family response regulator|nr:response regulator [Frankiaceae bacterium]